eukprot:scaffold19777_cov169-Isochrysis_galbana.AAC.1
MGALVSPNSGALSVCRQPSSITVARTQLSASSSKWASVFTTKQGATARKNTKGSPNPSPALSPPRVTTAATARAAFTTTNPNPREPAPPPQTKKKALSSLSPITYRFHSPQSTPSP